MRLLSSLLDLKNKELMIQNAASEIRVKNSQNRALKLELAISFLLVLFILFTFFWFQQKSKLKIKQQQIFSARRLIEFEEAEKGRIGFELHDTIGYLLRIIQNSIHSIEFPDPGIKDSIRQQLTDMGETIRRISHRMNPVRQENSTFQELFADIVNDMKNLTGMKVKYFIPDHIPVLSREIMLHFCRITEELLTNASKYAKDSSITIQIACVENRLLLLYSDGGNGFDPSSAGKSGIGLNSIFARATLLNGKAILKTERGKGTSWDISVPL
jgi:signal transduction histidine kinase